MRAFVGLPLPDDLTDRLEELAAGLRFGRAVPAENMHVTLAFLDEQPEDVLAELHAVLEEVECPAPTINIEGLGLFGGDKPRLLFASVEQGTALSHLREKVRTAARSAGVTLAHKRFRPHISLRRFQRLAPTERMELDTFLAARGAFTWPAFDASEMQLVQSTLSHDGAHYDALATYPFET
ncbi:RNA 2',3'-cyclic phosphodiesterase [Celeribacter litoreus]|uniref:RNA 2',3'-cyclic phosphodiesterase n=1 Tax=Celeribacter litoreus TaxID=2876714 RepID=UPI001CD01B79|nr:RNA 2',3'-cyclic phosphodiesterase [Celeribacter litoreus]MCA0044025.1 RNA 2',3'-cyclic phosphodiesterase [Celeribacter litoreus]